jgi:predicted acylesterase/phospholipase RssA
MHERDLAITFAGGGNRAFYQLGLMRRWYDDLAPRIAAIASCSAGACVAALHFAERSEPTGAYWRSRVAGIQRNFDWTRLLKGQPPAPHGKIYRDTLLHCGLEGGLERIRAQPFPILVLTAALPPRLHPLAAVALGLTSYNLEKKARPQMIHPAWGRRIGFTPAVFDMRDCETPEALADLILASSSTPPFTPLGHFGGQHLLDGGMVDNVPAFVAEQHAPHCKNLILLTRPYPPGATQAPPHRLYIAPTRPTPVDRWDYTRPHLVDDTLTMGEQEAELHRPALDAFLQRASEDRAAATSAADSP